MIKLIKIGDAYVNGTHREYVMDSASDISDLPGLSECASGSVATTADGIKLVLSPAGTWEVCSSYSGNGSGSSSGGAVSSVNGKTGAVVLSAEDVGASEEDHTHNSFVVGTNAFGSECSISIGNNAKANGVAAMSLGGGCLASGTASSACGVDATAMSTLGFYPTIARGYKTFALDGMALGINATANAVLSSAVGSNTSAFYMGEFVLGQYNVHSKPLSATAGGNNAYYARSYNDSTTTFSIPEDYGATAITRVMLIHLDGESTVLDKSAYTTSGNTVTLNEAPAKYTIVNLLYTGTSSRDDTSENLFVIGNGTSKTSLSNAHTVDRSGNAWYQGKVESASGVLKLGDTEITESQLKQLLDLLES